MSNIDWSNLRKAAHIKAEAEAARLAPLIAVEVQWAEQERKRVAEIRAAEEQRIKETEEAKKNGKAKPEGDKSSESTSVKAEEKVDKES